MTVKGATDPGAAALILPDGVEEREGKKKKDLMSAIRGR